MAISSVSKSAGRSWSKPSRTSAIRCPRKIASTWALLPLIMEKPGQ